MAFDVGRQSPQPSITPFDSPKFVVLTSDGLSPVEGLPLAVVFCRRDGDRIKQIARLSTWGPFLSEVEYKGGAAAVDTAETRTVR